MDIVKSWIIFGSVFAAKKYLMEGLVSRCQSFLKEEMSEDNVCTILNHCIRYDEKQLTDDCVNFLTSNSHGVFQSEGFLGLSEAALFELLSNDKFGLPNEIDLLKACIKWTTAQGKMGSTRHILGEALYQIRFHVISAEDLLEINEDSDLLTNEETL